MLQVRIMHLHCLAVLASLSLLPRSDAIAIMGIDSGSEFMKVSPSGVGKETRRAEPYLSAEPCRALLCLALV